MCKEDIKMCYYIFGVILLDFCWEEIVVIEIVDLVLRRVVLSFEVMDLFLGCGVGVFVGLIDIIWRVYLKDRKVES